MKSCPWTSHHLLRRIFWMSHLIPTEICWIPTEITWRIMIPSPPPGTIRHLPPKAVPVLTALDQTIPEQTHLMTIQKVKCHCSPVTFREVFVWTKFIQNPKPLTRNHANAWFLCITKSVSVNRVSRTKNKLRPIPGSILLMTKSAVLLYIGCRFLLFRHSKHFFVIKWLVYNSYLLQIR